VKHHRILGLVIDERMNWNKHIQDVKEKADKKLNLTKCLSHMSWGTDQKMLLKIHQMIKLVLKKLDPIQHRGVRLALRKRIMRSGLTNTNGNDRRKHDEDRNKNIDERKSPHQITNDKPNIFDYHAMKPGSPKPFFIQAAELLGQMDINERKVGKTLTYIKPPLYTDGIFHAEFQKLVNEKYNDPTRINTDGSKKEEKVG
jgi:hypothetical protein